MPSKIRMTLLGLAALLIGGAMFGGVATAGLSSVQVVSDQSPRNSASPKTAKVKCPNNTVMTGGGALVLNGRSSVALQSASRERQGNWAATAIEVKGYSLAWAVRSQAFCVTD